MQITWVCGILKSTMTKSTEYQPGWKHKITLSESVSISIMCISPLFSKSTHQTRHIQCWFNVEPPYSKLAHHQLQLQFTVSPICRICRTTCYIIRIHEKRKVSVYLQTVKESCHCLRGGVA